MTDAEEKAWSDGELMARVAGGDRRAFARLVQRHEPHVLNLIHRSLGDRAQAQDVAQEVFLRVWRAAKEYEPKAKFTTWVYRIAVNLCLDALKSAHHKQSFIYPDAGSEEQGDNRELLYGSEGVRSPEELLMAKEEGRRIFAALRDLPANQRLAVVLKKFDGLPYDEIGRILGCSVPAVESLLVRAKKALRDKLFRPGS